MDDERLFSEEDLHPDGAAHGAVQRHVPADAAAHGHDRERFMSALSYAGVLFVVPLFFVRGKSPFLQFHLRQGMTLFLLEALLMALPYRGWMLVAVPVIASLYGILQAAAGREWQLPFFGKYARRIHL